MKWTVDAIIFDFDGVVVNTGGDIANAANYVLQHYGLPELSTPTIVSYIGGGAEPLLRRCLGEEGSAYFDEALPMFISRYKEYFFVDTCLYPGVRDVLEHYHNAGKRMAIATNKIERIAQGIQEGLGIDHYFEIMIGPESVTHRKPHPEALNKIFDKIEVERSKTLMIGDTAADILAGKNAGTLTCGVTYGFGKVEEIRDTEPDFMIDEASELLNYID